MAVRAPETRVRDWRLPVLLAAVVVLVLNDFVLKPALGTWWTGKLSDVAGLFAFAFFWTLLFPRRRWWIAAITALGFVFWKSPASQPLIDAVNGLLPLRLGRTVDASDLIALVVIAPAVVLASRHGAWPLRRVRDLALAGLSLFAFAATEALPTGTDYTSQLFFYEKDYTIEAPAERVVFELAELGPVVTVSSGFISFQHSTTWEECQLDASGAVEPVDSAETTLHLEVIGAYCGPVEADSLQVLGAFEDSVVTPLRERIAQ